MLLYVQAGSINISRPQDRIYHSRKRTLLHGVPGLLQMLQVGFFFLLFSLIADHGNRLFAHMRSYSSIKLPA